MRVLDEFSGFYGGRTFRIQLLKKCSKIINDQVPCHFGLLYINSISIPLVSVGLQQLPTFPFYKEEDFRVILSNEP